MSYADEFNLLPATQQIRYRSEHSYLLIMKHQRSVRPKQKQVRLKETLHLQSLIKDLLHEGLASRVFPSSLIGPSIYIVLIEAE
ncbi:hypothetical protein J2Z69_002247 [Paenibacillus shirakamiensis]|uniref:Uncharacterized protein n=1 Tax=Paenibacillus shirakamiensis TaxID=1265935 RepID=A0ABS4JHK3_9BACL|nr:hypothetical protein [Paenibacillus shirakamiensis]MBP2001204.1 hypothetical protein [Paenibacillus shirakamiensis]